MTSRKKTLVVKPSTPPTPNTLPWYRRVWVIVVSVATMAFTLGLNGPTLLQNIRLLPSEVEAAHDQFVGWLKEDVDWTGDWSTFPEGIVNIADMHLSDGVVLKISLHSNKGTLGGMVATRRICTSLLAFDFLLLRGSISGNTANVEVWDIVGGHERVFGSMKLVRENGIITIWPDKRGESWFPTGVRIGKHSNQSTENFMADYCNRRQPHH